MIFCRVKFFFKNRPRLLKAVLRACIYLMSVMLRRKIGACLMWPPHCTLHRGTVSLHKHFIFLWYVSNKNFLQWFVCSAGDRGKMGAPPPKYQHSCTQSVTLVNIVAQSCSQTALHTVGGMRPLLNVKEIFPCSVMFSASCCQVFTLQVFASSHGIILFSPSTLSLLWSRRSSAETQRRSVCLSTSLKTSMLWWGYTQTQVGIDDMLHCTIYHQRNSPWCIHHWFVISRKKQ